MSQRRRRVLLVIDILTIAFIIIQIQSMVSYFRPENYYHYPFEEQLYDSFRLYVVAGWSDILHDTFGRLVPLTKFSLFLASIYAVIAETVGIVKKNLSTKFVVLILVKLLFITLSLIRFDTYLTHLMSV